MMVRESEGDRIDVAIEPFLAPLPRLSMVMSIFKRHLSCGRLQSREAQQVVGSAEQMSVQLHAGDAAEACATQTAVALHPAEDLLDPLALLLTDPVVRMPCGASVQSRRGSVLDLRDVRANTLAAQVRHKILGVLALVGAEATGRQALARLALEQLLGWDRRAATRA